MAYTTYSGPYSATYNEVSIGQSKDGFTINKTYHQQDVKTDEFGEGIVDQLQYGEDMTVTLTWVEYAKILPAIVEQEQSGNEGCIEGEVGKSLFSKAKALVLTPIGTGGGAAAARNNNNDIYTFDKAIVVDDVDILLSSKLREGPITFRIYPDTSSAEGEHYTKSTV